MHFRELREQLKDFLVFSTGDIKKIDSNFHSQQLSGWQKKGFLTKIINGHYIFSDTPLDENALFLIANTLYEPSYVSLEMALSYYGLIPESVYGVTSVSSRTTRKFVTDIATFSYRKMKPELFFGFTLIPLQNRMFKIAEPEKAILDFLFFRPDVSSPGAVLELRVNRDIFLERVDIKKLKDFSDRFKSVALHKRLKLFCTTLSLW
jgi:predicted transcriptional regulator of viral defense system